MFSFRLFSRAALALGAIIVSAALALPAFAAEPPGSFADLVEKLSPAVVNVYTTQKVKGQNLLSPFGNGGQLPPGQEKQLRDFFERFGMPGGDGEDQSEHEVQSLGSGFVIDPTGYIVSNNHVIDDAKEISVRFQDNTQYKAKLVGRDAKTDLALLKIEPKKELPYVKFGNSDEVRVGDWIVAIGNPYGLGGSVTAGIISATERSINAGPFDDFLQTDAAINRGNSGGPMFNMKGEVIGVNTAIFSPNGGNIGIGFSIPSTMAEPVLKQLREFGRTHRGWLGVKIQQVNDEVAESLGLSNTHGALVLEVTPGSPAAKVGIKTGDLITKFDGKEISEMRFLPRMVAETKIGKTVEVIVWRDGKEKSFDITLGELKEDEVADKETTGDEEQPQVTGGEKVLGLQLKPLDADIRSQFEIGKGVQGLFVTDIDHDSEAAKRGMSPGDVLNTANNKQIASVADFKDAIKEAKSAGRKYILLRIYRGGDTAFVTLPVE